MPTTWNPTGLGAGLALSNGNLTVSRASTGTAATAFGTFASPSRAMVIAGSTAAILDNGGGVWTISGGIINRNYTAAGSTANANLLTIFNGTIWHRNVANNWYSWNGTTWSSGSQPFDPVTGTTSTALTGNVFFEVRCDTLSANWTIGLCNASFPTTGEYLGNETNGLGIYPVSQPQALYINNTILAGTGNASSNGDTVSVAVNWSAKRLWYSTAAMRAQGRAWNNSTTATPATAASGVDFSSIPVIPFRIAFNTDLAGSATLNTLGPFVVTPPSGFAAWDTSAQPLTWQATARLSGDGQVSVLPTVVPASGTNVSVTLTGVSASPALGTLTPTGSNSASVTTTLTGVAASPQLGTIDPRITLATDVGTLADAIFFAAEVEAFRPGESAITYAYGIGSHPRGAIDLFAAAPPDVGIIRASDLGYRTRETDGPGLVVYPPVLTSAFQINRKINIDPTAGENGVASQWGAITIANPNGEFDDIYRTWNSDGRPTRVYWGNKLRDLSRGYVGDPPWAGLRLAFAGTAAPWSLGDEGLAIPIRDKTYHIEQLIQKRQYGGTGGYDGTAELAGTDIPMVRGGRRFLSTSFPALPVTNVTPVLIDPVALIFQYTDTRGQIEALWEGGAQTITNAGDTTNLYVGTTPPGQYRTDNARGLFQLGSTPAAQITVDCYGWFPSGTLASNIFQIARLMLIDEMGLTAEDIDTASFTSAEVNFPYVGGVFIEPGSGKTGVGAVSELLASAGAKLVPMRNGTLKLIVLRASPTTPIASANFDTTNIVTCTPIQLPPSLDPPPYRFRVGFRHCYTIQTSGFLGSATTARRTLVGSADRYATWINRGTLGAYRKPNDPQPVVGGLLAQSDAQAVANALGALWGNAQRAFDITVPAAVGLGVELGDYINVTYPLSDLEQGRAGQIIAEEFNSLEATVKYTVIGLRAGLLPLPPQVQNVTVLRTTSTSADIQWSAVAGSNVRYQVMYRPR